MSSAVKTGTRTSIRRRFGLMLVGFPVVVQEPVAAAVAAAAGATAATATAAAATTAAA